MTQGLAPGKPETELAYGHYRVVPRRWQVGIWDWALLATEHDLKVPYQFADLAAQTVNLEIAVEANDVSTAVSRARALRVFLAANSIVPVSMPTVSTHSLNGLFPVEGVAGVGVAVPTTRDTFVRSGSPQVKR